MHDVLKPFKRNPSQKFQKTSIILKNPKNFQKPKKLG